MAETVGSIMGNHCGKGRYLTPENFSDELYLGERMLVSSDYLAITISHSCPECNLGPLFLLKDLASLIYEKKNKNYVYKRKPSGRLATYYTQLRDHVEGSAVDTHRRLEAEKARLPTGLWKRSQGVA